MFIFMHHAEMVTRPMRKELINGIFMERSPKISGNALPTTMSAFLKTNLVIFEISFPPRKLHKQTDIRTEEA